MYEKDQPLPQEVTVFPVAPDRWILEFDDYSSECSAARDVESTAQEASGYFSHGQSREVFLVDDRGVPWDAAMAPAQAKRLGVEWPSSRPSIIDRLFPRNEGRECPVCGHRWDAHPPKHRECIECTRSLRRVRLLPHPEYVACDYTNPSGYGGLFRTRN